MGKVLSKDSKHESVQGKDINVLDHRLCFTSMLALHKHIALQSVFLSNNSKLNLSEV